MFERFIAKRENIKSKNNKYKLYITPMYNRRFIGQK
jgi:hypothetical protein